MFSDNHIVNDLVLCVINDGNGSECGISYEQRCQAAMGFRSILSMRQAARECGHYQHKVYGTSVPTRKELVEAGNILANYYDEHVKEF